MRKVFLSQPLVFPKGKIHRAIAVRPISLNIEDMIQVYQRLEG